MKVLSLSLFISVSFFIIPAQAELSPDPDSQAQALAKYPALGTVGTPLNKLFNNRVREAREQKAPILNDPRWPLLIADTAAADLNIKAVTALAGNTGALGADGGRLQRFLKLSAAEVVAKSFSLEGAMIEVTGFHDMDIREISRGTSEVRIWPASGSGSLLAELPNAAAETARRSKTLYISVTEASSSGPAKIHIHGNKATYAGLSTLPTVTWAR